MDVAAYRYNTVNVTALLVFRLTFIVIVVAVFSSFSGDKVYWREKKVEDKYTCTQTHTLWHILFLHFRF